MVTSCPRYALVTGHRSRGNRMRAHTPASMTDLYELTMAAGYWAARRDERAVFEFFVRRLPGDRNYMLAAGLDSVADYLENLRFTSEEIAYLRGVPVFSATPAQFFDALAALRFTGDAWAVPEGTPVFPNEPILTIAAPLIEAQIVETALLALINYPTSVASKAARIVAAARERPCIEFGARRAHGTEAALIAARAAFIGGCGGTSNVEAGLRFEIPLFGTVAHAWIMSFAGEIEAFRAYQRAFPDNAILLIDTYDTLRAAREITRAFAPGEVAAVRLDSGNLLELSRGVREIFDAAGFSETGIVASGDLDERSIDGLLARGAPIDSFGVGTELTVVRDAPSLGGVYKLVEIEREGRREMTMKASEGKATYPGHKQVWRHTGPDGRFSGDTVALVDEPGPPGAAPLLVPILRGGRRVGPPPPLAEIRQRAREAVAMLPAPLLGLDAPAEPYPVRFSDQILATQRKIREVLL
jgi:nicotinate phosphoribosyltransferase